MKPRHVYLLLCIAGFLAPYAVFLPWVAAHGLDPVLFVHQACATPIGIFFALDVVVAVLALFAFVGLDVAPVGWRARVAACVATLVVGVSFGLPLYLFFRTRAEQ
jgi:hypothetical protein